MGEINYQFNSLNTSLGEKHKAKALGIMESGFGLGYMAGPLIGGVLYNYGGFCLPFVVIGSTLVMCFIVAHIILKTKLDNRPAHAQCETTKVSETEYKILLKIPQDCNSPALI